MKDLRIAKKNIVGMLLLVAIFMYLFMETASAQEWAITFGGGGHDYARSIQQTSDGGYVVAGGTQSFGSYPYHMHILISKLNADGTISWTKTYSGNYEDANSIQQTSDGGYIVAGNNCCNGPSNNDYMLALKLNSDGTIAWQKTYGEGSSYARSIQQTADGGYIMCGKTGGGRIGVFKLNSDGTVVWNKAYGGGGYGGYDDVYSIQETEDLGYVLAGHTNNWTNPQDRDIWVLKLNSDGTIAWQKTYGGSAMEWVQSIQQTMDGGYILAGYSASFSAVGYEMWVMKLNSDGTIAWQKTYGGILYASSIQQTPDGGYIVAANSVGTEGNDISILKLDSDGSVLWHKSYFERLYDHASSIEQTVDGGFIVAGETQLLSYPNYDFFILKLDANGEIPYSSCPFAVGTSNPTVTETNSFIRDTTFSAVGFTYSTQQSNIVATDAGLIPTILCPSPDISATPSPVNFGPVQVGSSFSQAVTISNVGGRNLAIQSSIAITGVNASAFAIQSDNCSGRILAPSDSCTLTVAFSPVATGRKEASLSIRSNDPDTSKLDVSLYGSGVSGIVTMLSPNGGEVIPSGSVYNIEWWAQEHAVKFDLQYSIDNGTAWITMATNVTGTSFNWSVPPPTANKKKCFVKVIGYNLSGTKVGEDISDANFQIEVVRLISPHEGEILQSGDTYAIIWQSNLTIRPVAKARLLYSLNGGTTYTLIKALKGNPWYYIWTVPIVTATKTNCKVKVVLKDSAAVTIGQDVSDKKFTIMP